MYHFIMNPSASSGKGMNVWKQIQEILDKEQVVYEQHVLKSAKETTLFVRELTKLSENENAEMVNQSRGSEDVHIVVLGGDGTINTVLNGIEDFSRTILSCIRTGSGNDFARNVGITKDVKEAINHLLHEPEEQCLDYGIVKYETDGKRKKRRFVISSGVGYDADICEEVSRSVLKKRLNRIRLGKMVYLAIGVKQIFSREVTGAVIRMDDNIEIKIPELFFVVGMIHEREGGGVPFCPKADATDGKLDVCLVQNMPRWKLLLAVMLVYIKKHYIFKKITEHQCQSMSIELEKPQWFHMDGETPCRVQKLELQCQSGLRFCK